ncbi:sigma-70 family RNA polymerase sigma factor [Pedobacter polaris]|uniref:Sigma-70 family RNA polymerase sigma factor n=1 Tax=Pedobacter polaris TaxID=2571273 RepID=A0A4U1CW60_9SPHI|nr:sigma-70 family RNA polymerase sigma factor [Pedobacter polaris]TKC13204.1 sigma-70 family RNA polymerase sigma factor [Pedobacter polaris]
MTFHSIDLLFRIYYKPLCKFAQQLISDVELAKDLVQDAFIAYWNNKESIADHEIAIKNFLYSSIRYACYNISRHVKVQERYFKIHQAALYEDSLLLQDMIRAEQLEAIYRLINTLPKACMHIFYLGYVEDLSNTDIAKKLGISINTVKTQKRRGLKMIREKINDLF